VTPRPGTGPAAGPPAARAGTGAAGRADAATAARPDAGQGAAGTGARILIVDDEPGLVRALRINLCARRYQVDTAPDGAGALAAAARRTPDLVILDLGLPDMDGVEVVRGLRGWCTAPIIVLSARQTQTDKVAALDTGADDYITKPFGMDELLARIRAALRRSTPAGQAPVVSCPAFTVDLAARRVTTPAGEVRLTPTEWHLLEILVRNPGKLVSQRQLLTEVWGPAYTTETNYLRVYLAQLRRKLEPDPAVPRHLITEPGMGYRFEPGN
jgi:two-component system, OmpR family, KDP operon response regulator KdpE